MAPSNSLWTVPSLQRYRPIIFALTALAAGCTIYYVHDSLWHGDTNSKARRAPHRSNAQRQRRRRARSTGPPPEPYQAPGGQQQPEETQIDVFVIDGAETDTDGASEISYEEGDDKEDESKDGQGLLLLLYKIAEEQARKDGYVHRGVQCNSCNENPIKGIRYRCVNCADYDLCEGCESMQNHPKTHLFYKIRIPAPFLGAHKERQPVFYPGKPRAINQDLRKEKLEKFQKETGYKVEEIEAFWEQFRCMAATEWANDPDHYHLAIDRPTFDKCFIPNTSLRPPPPNLIYDRIFSFYDVNNDGLIGFGEFIGGLASLKKKNAKERLKRLFKGYDINNDGYVDRRDFLRMFRAYYSLTKELTSEIVAGMQDAEDEGDARELITSGQPISSAFTGSIPRGDRRPPREGKIRNDFGDYVVVVGGGALDEKEFDARAELYDLIADNVEAARWPMPRVSSSGNMIYELVNNRPWDQISELMKLRNIPVDEVIDEKEKSVLRRKLHVKLALEFQRRRFDRRKAIMDRAQRQSFYQDHPKAHFSIDIPLVAGGMLADPRLHTLMGKDLAEILESSKKADQLKSFLVNLIEILNWPIENAKDLARSMLEMVSLGWGERALIQDLDGYSRNPEEIEVFVKAFSEVLSRLATESRHDPGFKRDFKKISVSRRSRSSSKVRFEASLEDSNEEDTKSATSISSRSRPANERWGNFEVPEPETDVGREILYHVTQQALNELLDPIFKLKEDLALAVLLQRKDRSKHRADIIAAVADRGDLLDVRDYLEWYQRRWRKQKARPPSLMTEQSDEALFFRSFVRYMVAGAENNMTGSFCPECLKVKKETFVRIGRYCTQRLNHTSKTTIAVPMELGPRQEGKIPPEKCKNCAKEGKESLIHLSCCGDCGQTSEHFEQECANLRKIISSGGENMSAEREAAAESQPSETESVSKDEAPSGCSRSQGPSSESTAEEPHTKRSPEDDLLKPSEQESTPEHLKTESTESEPTPDSGPPTHEYRDDETYPDMAVDLQHSVAAFNEADPSPVEADIASKPLEDLLIEAGYASSCVQSSRQATPASPTIADPTLPQNRPNNAAPVSIPSARPSPSSTPLPSPSLVQAQADATNAMPTPSMADSSSAESQTKDIPNHNTLVTGSSDEALYKYYAALDILEAEDKERGGPGRLSFDEFEEIMIGEKGQSLGFLANWVEIGAF